MWVGNAVFGSLKYRYADPLDAEVVGFTCGTDMFASEVNRYFHSSAWTRSSQPTTVLEFGFDRTPAVALCAIRLAPPSLVILVLGIASDWQGKRDPADQAVRLVDAIIETMVIIAAEQGATELRLRVRRANIRALSAYARNGFVEVDSFEDPHAGPTLELSRPV